MRIEKKEFSFAAMPSGIPQVKGGDSVCPWKALRTWQTNNTLISGAFVQEHTNSVQAAQVQQRQLNRLRQSNMYRPHWTKVPGHLLQEGCGKMPLQDHQPWLHPWLIRPTTYVDFPDRDVWMKLMWKESGALSTLEVWKFGKVVRQSRHLQPKAWQGTSKLWKTFPQR